ncbi:MAG: Fic family protein [Eubacteriales bacterium]|nr:Fic family protein [Eubacteriales bacterium]
MEYESLNKLFYKNPDCYEDIYRKRFQSEDTIHLDFEVHGNPAFLCPNAEMWQIIFRIQRVNNQICKVRWSQTLPQSALDQFTARCLVDEIVLTNDIEGVNSTRKEIREVLDKMSCSDTRVRKRFQGLISKYVRLQSDDRVPLSNCQNVRDLYDELVLPEVLDENPENEPDGVLFRKGPVSVLNTVQKEIHRGILPEARIIDAMERALRFLNKEDINPFIRISAFHYLFGYIHPFYDGNGRTSRFISSYLLSREVDPLIGYRLSYTIKENLKKYYDSFKICNDTRSKGDITPFILMFLEIIEETMSQLAEALEERCHDFRFYTNCMSQDELLSNEKYIKVAFLLIQAALFSADGISNRELQQYAEISYKTLRNRLDKIAEKGLLRSNKVGKEKFYQLDLDVLAAMCSDT